MMNESYDHEFNKLEGKNYFDIGRMVEQDLGMVSVQCLQVSPYGDILIRVTDEYTYAMEDFSLSPGDTLTRVDGGFEVLN